MRQISIRCDAVEYSTDPVDMRLNFDSWFKRRILHVPNWIEIKLNNLCLLEWESLALSNFIRQKNATFKSNQPNVFIPVD